MKKVETKVFTSLDSMDCFDCHPTVFLAGSIDPNKEQPWRDYAQSKLLDKFNVLDPRYYKPWLTIADEAEHINWELKAMEGSDIILMNLLAENLSPVSLVEFGMHAKSGKLLVVCHDKFWKREYIVTVCSHYQIPLFSEIDRAIDCVNQFYS